MTFLFCKSKTQNNAKTFPFAELTLFFNNLFYFCFQFGGFETLKSDFTSMDYFNNDMYFVSDVLEIGCQKLTDFKFSQLHPSRNVCIYPIKTN